MPPYGLGNSPTWREVFEKVVPPAPNDKPSAGCEDSDAREGDLEAMNAARVSVNDMRAWGFTSVHLLWEEGQSTQRYEARINKSLDIDSLVQDIVTIGLPDPKNHPHTDTQDSVISAMSEGINRVVNSALREIMPAASPFYFIWLPDAALATGLGRLNPRLYKAKRELGKALIEADKLIKIQNDPRFRVIAALIMGALDGEDGIWLREDADKGMTLSGESWGEAGGDDPRMEWCINELITRQSQEILLTSYSLGFVMRIDQKLPLNDGNASLQLKVSPMVGNQGRVIGFQADGQDFKPQYDVASSSRRLTDRLLGLKCGFSLPSSTDEDRGAGESRPKRKREKQSSTSSPPPARESVRISEKNNDGKRKKHS
ncbi:hypothetical protein I350_02902 [Cryptococcus amylolentus CBS 6273]|uniref:Uncharacterized protein n=1 Tax=Cryptococcus amylolentus CBS 6273 TaxID=1296118 RepID=A0A1E3KAJ0_9TREE|nr:hypothetical protein I350_02902 [Cryptococcus amylolentus CBS 6273]